MAEVKVEVIKDDYGEVHVKIECDFVYYKPKDDIFSIKAAFEETMMRFAI